LVEYLGHPFGAITRTVFGAVVVAVVENDNGKRPLPSRDLHDPGDGQPVAGIGNRITGIG
jgi:hypothetical protein